jgi:hypothetical protein
MAAEDPQTRLRFPPDLKARLEEEAAKNSRSLNAEVVARLRQTLLPANELNDVEGLRRVIALMEEAARAKDALIQHYETAQQGTDFFWRQSVHDLLSGRKLTDKQRREYEVLLRRLNERLHGIADAPASSQVAASGVMASTKSDKD